MKADLGCVWADDATSGPYSTSTPFILLPGTFGRAWSKTSVTFGPSSTAIAESAPIVPMSAQTRSAQMKRGISPGFEVWIGFIVMFLSCVWLGYSCDVREEIVSVFCLGYGAAEPIVVTRSAEMCVIARSKALIVQFCAEVEGMDVRGHLPWVSRCAQKTPGEFIHSDSFGAGDLDCTV